MKILYFHQHFSTPEGTTGIRSYQMAKRLIARGHQVTIVCGTYGAGKTGLNHTFSKGYRRGQVDGIEIIEFNLAYSNQDNFISRAWTFAKFAFKAIRLALVEPYDILFATSTPLTVAIPGIFARWIRRKPFIFEVRDLWPELPRAMGVIRNPWILRAISLLEWLSYHSAHRLIGLSPGIVKGIVERGISSENVGLIPNACDLNLFSKGDPWRPEEIKADDFLAVFSGTHGIANGLDAVLDAASVLKTRRRENIKILLIGEGKLKSALQSRAQKEELNNVVFYKPVDKLKLAGLMKASNLGLQILSNVPAFYNGTSPNKFFDYIASGLPVLNNYPGWLAELIRENDCGLVVKPDSPEDFADALEYAASRPLEMKEKGQRALCLAKSNFDRIELADQWVDHLESLWGIMKPKVDTVPKNPISEKRTRD